MRSRIEMTRFGLRLLGVCLLVWCWWRIVGNLSHALGAASVGHWVIAKHFGQELLNQLTSIFQYDATTPWVNGRQTRTNLDWSTLTWYFRLGLGTYLTFFNAALARLLWKGLQSDRSCAACGYSRGGLAADAACPECGVGV